MDLAMRDKKAIVTGASEGIGKAITRALAREAMSQSARDARNRWKKPQLKSPRKPVAR